MKTLLVDNGSKLILELSRSIPGDLTLAAWDKLASLRPSDFDLVVLSGGSLFSVAGNEERLKDELRIIREDKKPLIGICFGCELIADAFGGVLERMPTDHQGDVLVSIEPAYRGFFDVESFVSYEHHAWKIKELPKDFVMMASSKHGPELIRHANLPIYGLQFHPEKVIEKGAGKQILGKILASLFK